MRHKPRAAAVLCCDGAMDLEAELAAFQAEIAAVEKEAASSTTAEALPNGSGGPGGSAARLPPPSAPPGAAAAGAAPPGRLAPPPVSAGSISIVFASARFQAAPHSVVCQTLLRLTLHRCAHPQQPQQQHQQQQQPQPQPQQQQQCHPHPTTHAMWHRPPLCHPPWACRGRWPHLQGPPWGVGSLRWAWGIHMATWGVCRWEWGDTWECQVRVGELAQTEKQLAYVGPHHAT